jgi:ABC-type branched-subunit amino acid transport system ATPase component
VTDERPLLQIDDVTVRFRGLTAVDRVSLDVRRGEIVAVIGPNGAGKTTLFNAITGIYEPTLGTVKLDGQNLQAQPRRGNYVTWALFGLAVGLLLFLWVADVNQLWSAVVKANYTDPRRGFQGDQALRDLGSFLAAGPRIELRTGRYYVTTFDGQSPFGSSRTRAEAEAKRAAIPEMAELPADGSAVEERAGKFAILSADRARVLDEAPTREVALERLAAARTADDASAAAVKKRLFALLLGVVLGAAGAWAVWRQTRRTPSSVAERGIARTFQNIRLFQNMTVQENVLVGMDRHLGHPYPFFSRTHLCDRWPLCALASGYALFWLGLRFGWLPPAAVGAAFALEGVGTFAYLAHLFGRGTFSPIAARVEAEGRTRAAELLAFVGLAARANELAKNLPYGAQRRLEIARALATRPQLLLLDEPAAGMNPAETKELMDLIREIRGRGVTVLLIEHHMRVVMGISDRIAVLVYGEKVAEGTPEEIRANPKVIEAYLGQEQVA